MVELKAARSDSSMLADLVRAQKQGLALGIASICSAHPLVLRSAFEQARGDGSSVLVESTSNQVNHEGGYTGMTPAEFVKLVSRLAEEAGLPADRVVLGGDHLGPNPWTDLAAAVAMERAAEMVRHYVRAGYVKLHLDASMRCADDPPGGPPDAPRGVAHRRSRRGRRGGRRGSRAGLRRSPFTSSAPRSRRRAGRPPATRAPPRRAWPMRSAACA